MAQDEVHSGFGDPALQGELLSKRQGDRLAHRHGLIQSETQILAASDRFIKINDIMTSLLDHLAGIPPETRQQ